MNTVTSIRDDLASRIVSKRRLQQELRNDLRAGDVLSSEATRALIEFIDTNVEELQQLLTNVQDVLDRVDAVMRTTR